MKMKTKFKKMLRGFHILERAVCVAFLIVMLFLFVNALIMGTGWLN